MIITAVFALSRSAMAADTKDAIDLSAATVVLAPGASGPEKKAADMLVDEIQKRSFVRLSMAARLPEGNAPTIVLGQRNALVQAFPDIGKQLSSGGKPEGYEVVSLPPGRVIISGNDARGVLFGAGRLLRSLDYGRERVTAPSNLKLASAPRYGVRGSQFSYRPKVNSYDGWTVPMWEQYIRDAIVFGANAIEIIPPRSDDDADSPHFTLSPIKMMIELSRLAQEYGIALWIWYPALDRDYSDPATVDFALKEWGNVLRQLPKVDALFVPGGDPGHTPPKVMFPMLEKQTAQLRRMHPNAQMWMSPQGFDAQWLEDFYGLMKAEPTWLSGVVFGPQQRVSLEELRAHIPAKYPIRLYPDITHTVNAQFPVPMWDFAYAATLNREPINPRPLDQAAIFRRLQPIAEFGEIAYSEGCNDDVNKCIWNSLAWNPDMDVTEILRDYARYFIGAEFAEGFAQGLLALERNWRGPLAINEGVYATLEQFQQMERAASPALLENWRFQQALYRAYYDATVRARLLAETVQEERAMEQLRRARRIGSEAAMAGAEAALAVPAIAPAADWRARVFELAEALFQSIRMQLSVPRYKAIAVGRGANLDLIDFPLNNAPWLRERFAEIRALTDEPERQRRIEAILNWSNPGPGGFYDDLGSAAGQPHLVPGTDYASDPAFLRAPHQAYHLRPTRPLRISSCTFMESRDDQPLEMLYRDLDRTAAYRVRVVYGTADLGARGGPMTLRLMADNRFEVHGWTPKPADGKPLEFDIPPEATADGELRLTWSRPAGLGGAGRGVQVAEVWLMRKPDRAASR